MEALLLDPSGQYADRFIRLLWQHHGVHTVALHTSWRGRVTTSASCPAATSPAVAANYMVDLAAMDDIAAMLRARHDIVAVVPHHESTVLPLHELAVRLGLSWAQPDVIPLFRNKGDLKEALRAADPTLRLNQTRRVHNVADVVLFLAETGVGRLVLKPNAGAGNQKIGFFDADVSQEALATYFSEVGDDVLAEEYVGGEEYFVDGQVDNEGVSHIVSVSKYLRVAFGDRENVEVGGRTLHTTDPHFQLLADYARAVIGASGLRRSPFHLEAKVDEAGTCLIEVAARLCGTNFAFRESTMHGGADIVGWAVEHYLTDSAVPVPALDWQRYDSVFWGEALGSAPRNDLIGTLQGIREVESLPQFAGWIERPRVGKRVTFTEDLVTVPWIAQFAAPSQEQLEDACARARSLVTWNVTDKAYLRPLILSRGGSVYVFDRLAILARAPKLLRNTQRGWQKASVGGEPPVS